jgi:hypothetical protein
MVWLSLVTAHGPAPIQCPTSPAGSKDMLAHTLVLLTAAAPPCISGRTSYLQVRLAFHLYPQVIPQFCNTGGFGPRRGLTPASPCPWVAHLVSGRILATHSSMCARFRLAFAPAPALYRALTFHTWPHALTRVTPRDAANIHSPDHSTKGTPLGGPPCRERHAGRFPPTACRCRGSEALSSPSRGAFHLSLTVLVHYRWPGVCAPWRVVPPASHRVSRAPWYSGTAASMPHGRCSLRDSHPLRWAFPDPSRTPISHLRPLRLPERDRHCPLNPAHADSRLRQRFGRQPGSLATTTGLSPASYHRRWC